MLSREMYEDINDLIRDLNLDPKDWINEVNLFFTSHKFYESTNVDISIYPKYFNENNFGVTECQNCLKKYKPNWLAKRPPTSMFRDRAGNFLRQESIHEICDNCGHTLQIKLPMNSLDRVVGIYGDEAFRELKKSKLYVYSCVSFLGDDSQKQNLLMQFNEIKRNLVPSIEPKEWVFHVKDLFTTESRRKNIIFQHIEHSSVVVNQVNKIIEIIKEFVQKDLLKVHVALARISPKKLSPQIEKKIKKEVFSSLTFTNIVEYTSKGLSPEFIFERTQDDGWAKNLFTQSRLTLMWSFITHGLPIKQPKFVLPNHDFLLEIADIICFCVARYIFVQDKRYNYKDKNYKVEIDIKNLGPIQYIYNHRDGIDIEITEGISKARRMHLLS
ncbi:hypothetical protein B4R90_15295 [Acinetobacter baumannii]|uniref:Uncharacterized protein n=3 Tax=Moraxellaceae TaxID=468 RepID=A0AAV3JW85_ACIBA|nr:hypothetical protein N173_07930 [Acinetobacter baumannii EGD-HP18]OVL07604.1 hypothetical protein B4R90_15295 [Acinetobacter baumannii]